MYPKSKIINNKIYQDITVIEYNSSVYMNYIEHLNRNGQIFSNQLLDFLTEVGIDKYKYLEMGSYGYGPFKKDDKILYFFWYNFVQDKTENVESNLLRFTEDVVIREADVDKRYFLDKSVDPKNLIKKIEIEIELHFIL